MTLVRSRYQVVTNLVTGNQKQSLAGEVSVLDSYLNVFSVTWVTTIIKDVRSAGPVSLASPVPTLGTRVPTESGFGRPFRFDKRSR